jgi:hypothetical protein
MARRSRSLRSRPPRRDFSLKVRYLSRPPSALSSAVEHHLDMVGVSGSIPLARTILMAGCRTLEDGTLAGFPLVRCAYARYYSSGRKSETI